MENGRLTHFCAGTLITENFILTAAHCCVEAQQRAKSPTPSFWARFRNTEIDKTGNHEFKHEIAEIFIHPHFESMKKGNDLCLLRVNENVQASKLSNPPAIACVSGND